MHLIAKNSKKIFSSSDIRKTFIDYFALNHDHKFVASSPIVPFCDPTLAFVNSGMNQFKSIFLDMTQPAHKRVCNSQKCARVGGKHNDLSVVGRDGYHHTFFEMLGNWSFGDYFKQEACQMAFDLLRGPFQINPEMLYVTYFGGDKELGLAADLECLEIWRSIGFPASRIIPFGSKDNFWEMGSTGPCGPCTEIHIDYRPNKCSEVKHSDLTELWNLVFIQYNRNADGSITKLPNHHVDTGMGLERLTAVLQNKYSNYDTDLFVPILKQIQKVSRAPCYTGSFIPENTLDVDYRTLADHARMVTVCLADGMLPDKNQKLRRVLRKALTISEKTFQNEHLLSEIIPVVVESLGAAYPELCNKACDVLEIIAHEQDVFKTLRKNSSKAFAEILLDFPELEQIELIEYPGLVPAYRDFISQKDDFKNNVIPGYFLFKLADTYGLTEEHFRKFAAIANMSLDEDGYKQVIQVSKIKARSSFGTNDAENSYIKVFESLSNIVKQLPPTKNHHKYIYKYDRDTKQYTIPTVNATVLSILHNNMEVTELNHVKPSDTICVLTDSSNFYYESGGQQSDLGIIAFKSNEANVSELNVVDVKLVNNCVLHICKPRTFENCMLAVGSSVALKVNTKHRTMNTFHHSATHLINAALRVLFHKVTYQLSSEVKADILKFEVGMIGKRLSKEDVDNIENLIRNVINGASPVDIQLITASDVMKQNDISKVPGEFYPETDLRLVIFSDADLNFHSKELCCGTHVLNTKEIEYFCITNMKQTNRAHYAFTAVAGPAAKEVLRNAKFTEQHLNKLEGVKPDETIEEELLQLRSKIMHSEVLLPFVFKANILQKLNGMLKMVKESAHSNLREQVELEMKNLLHENPIKKNPFIVYVISRSLVDEFPLQKATKLCNDRPILVIGICKGVIKARCCVPEKYASEKFNAEKWLKELAVVFNFQVSPPKGQNAFTVCNMRGKKNTTNYEKQLNAAVQRIKNFAELNLSLKNEI